MPYFFLALAFALWMVAGAGGTAVSWWWQPLRPAFPFVWRSWLWGTIGILAANLLLATAAWAVFSHWSPGPHVSDAGGMLIIATILIGPFAAAGVGVVAGMLFGCWLAQRRAALPESALDESLGAA